MDHLPKIRDPAARLPRVPYLEDSRFAYTGPFETFGSRTRVPEILDNAVERRRVYSSFVQSWLYFGLLQDFFGKWSLPVSNSDFIEEADDGRFVTSVLLPDYLVAVVAYEHQRHSLLMRDKPAANTARGYVAKDLGPARHRIFETHDMLQKHHDVLQYEINENDVEPAVWDSVILLGASLARAKDVIFRPVFNFTEDIFQSVSFSNFHLRSIPDFRSNEKWCRHERKIITELVDERLPEMAFISQLDRHEAEGMHAACKANECVAYQVTDKSAYKTRHVKDDCTCDFIGFNDGNLPTAHDDVEKTTIGLSKSLSRMISDTLPKEWSKRVPAITFKDGKVERVTVPLAEANVSGWLGLPMTGWNLVAMSHVWADGLGNPNENKLPTCQLDRIQNLVNGLYKESQWPVPFWIDTLMIPVFPDPVSEEQKREQKKIKNAALRDMEWVYKGASKVLVLDRGLFSTPTDHMEAEELGARIMISTWSRRLWTLQEGCNKDRVLFQFQDQALSWPKLHDQIQSHSKLSNWKSHSKLPKKHAVRKAQSIDLIRVKDYKMKWNFGDILPSQSEITMTSPMIQAMLHADKRLFKVVNQIWHSILSFLQEMTVDWSGGLKGEPLARCMRAMYYRNCSNKEDEPLVLTSLLSWQAGSAAKLTENEAKESEASKKEDRYKTLFHEFKYVPLDILFVDQTRYDEYGSRWVPTSLLSINTALGKPIARTEHIPKAYNINNMFRVRKFSPMCEREEHGIVTALKGLRVLPRPSALKAPFQFQHKDKRWEVHLHHPGTEEEISDFGEGDWVLIPEQSFEGKPLSCQAILVEVIEWHKHRPGGRTKFAALARLMLVSRQDDGPSSLPCVEVESRNPNPKMTLSDLKDYKRTMELVAKKSPKLYDKWVVG